MRPYKKDLYLILLLSIVLLAAGVHQTAAQAPCDFPVFLNGKTFASGDHPFHAARGDVNNDNKIDVVTANFDSNDISVLLGTGTGSFQTAINIPADTRPSFVALKDLSTDGKLDAVVFTVNKITIMIGDGAGNFSIVGQYSIYNPLNMHIADVNNDGKQDLMVMAGDSNVGKMAIYPGNGSGGFGTSIDTTIPGLTTALAGGDFNGDGFIDFINSVSNGTHFWAGNGTGTFADTWVFSQATGLVFTGNFDGVGGADLVISNPSIQDLWVLTGNGDGSFQMRQRYATRYGPGNYAAVADMNRDGLDDLLVSIFTSNEISIFLSTGGGTFAPAKGQSGSGDSRGLVVADFNGDAKWDVVTTSQRNDSIMLTLGRGDGTLIAPATYPVFQESFPNAAVVKDLDNNGKEDIVTANSEGWGVSVFLRTGNYKFAPQQRYLQSKYVNFVTVNDFNGDSALDIVAVGGPTATVLIGDGAGHFTVSGTFPVGSEGAFATWVGAADLNGDGKLDLVVPVSVHGLTILFGNGNGSFSAPQQYQDMFDPVLGGAIGDFNADGKPDLALVVDSGVDIWGRVQIRLNAGNGTFPTFTNYRVGVSIHPKGIAVNDLNGDGKLDFVVTTLSDPTTPGQARIYTGDGAGAFSGPVSYDVGGIHPYSVTVGDFNADGIVDMGTVNYLSEDVTVFSGTGGGAFSRMQSISVGDGARMLTLGNLNADTSPDLIVTNYNSDTFSILPNGCNQTVDPVAAKPFDYDGDGKADVSVFRPSSGDWYLLNSTTGYTGFHFGAAGDLLAPADLDGDGKTDVAVFRASVGGWYWLNSSNGSFSATTFGQTGDLPTPADYDGDGKADIAVFRPSTGDWYRMNSSNGQFVAVHFGSSEDKPALGDYDGDGKADISIFRPSTGSWYRLNSSNAEYVGVHFGVSEDKPTPADYDGDGKTDISVYRPSVGDWYRLNSSTGAFAATHFGGAGDKPAAADFDGDGKADICVFRPSDGNWYQLNSTAGFGAVHFGISEDLPTPNAFVF